MNDDYRLLVELGTMLILNRKLGRLMFSFTYDTSHQNVRVAPHLNGVNFVSNCTNPPAIVWPVTKEPMSL